MQAEIRSYRDLRVWNESNGLGRDSVPSDRTIPEARNLRFTAQVRRAAASVPANIAEGYGRDSKGAYVQFLRVAQGSVKELETHLLLAVRIELIPSAAIEPVMGQCETVGKMLRGLIRSLDKDS